MRAKFLALLAIPLAASFAGCQTAPPVTHAGLAPSAGPWLVADAPLWVAWSSGCGMCSGSPDHPEFTAVGLYRDGKVLTVAYSLGTGANGTVEFASSAPPGLRDAAGTLLSLSVYAKGDGSLRVHDARAETLRPGDFAALRAVLEGALRDAREPEPSDEFRCDDCGGYVVESFGDPVAHRFAPNLESDQVGPGLAKAANQMADLWQWGQPAATPL
jgi:hypothetical protein